MASTFLCVVICIHGDVDIMHYSHVMRNILNKSLANICIRRTATTYDKPTKSTHREIHEYMIDGNRRMLIEYVGEDRLRMIHCINDTYSFHIQETAKDKWILKRIAANSNKDDVAAIRKFIDLYDPRRASYGLGTDFIFDSIDAGKIKPIDVKEEEGEVSVKYTLHDPDGRNPVTGGRFTLDKKSNYRSTGFSLVVRRKGAKIDELIETKISYVSKSDLFPLTAVTDAINVQSTYLYEPIEPFPEAAFYAKYYGLPEPSWGNTTPAVPWFLYLSFGGVLLIVTAILLQRRLRVP